MKNDQKFKEAKEKLVRCLNLENDRQLTVDDIRLWKINYQYNSRDKMVGFLKDHRIGG